MSPLLFSSFCLSAQVPGSFPQYMEEEDAYDEPLVEAGERDNEVRSAHTQSHTHTHTHTGCVLHTLYINMYIYIWDTVKQRTCVRVRVRFRVEGLGFR